MEVEGEEAILNYLFNPHLGVSFLHSAGSEDSCSPNEKQLAIMEKESVLLAEAGKDQEALEKLNQVLATEPQRLSALNNRAQLFRLQKTEEGVQKALLDLTECLRLATPPTCDKARRIALLAYRQRALIYHQMGKSELFQKDNEEARKLHPSENEYAKMCHTAVAEMMRQQFS